MKFKCLAAAVLACTAQAALADPYQVEAGLSYTDVEDVSVLAVGGEFYFKQVDTEGHLLEEAWFLEHVSSVGLAYAQTDTDFGDIDALVLGLSYFVPNIPVYLGAQIANVDTPAGSDTSYAVDLGYYANGFLAYTTYNEDVDYEPNVTVKYVSESSDGTGFNIDGSVAMVDEGDDFFGLGFDYYFSRSTSVGVMIENAADTAYGVRAQHFFAPKFSAGVSYLTQDDFDAVTVEASIRF